MAFKRLNSGDFSVSEAPIITQIHPILANSQPRVAWADFSIF